jgi:hypothetical protein
VLGLNSLFTDLLNFDDPLNLQAAEHYQKDKVNFIIINLSIDGIIPLGVVCPKGPSIYSFVCQSAASFLNVFYSVFNSFFNCIIIIIIDIHCNI